MDFVTSTCNHEDEVGKEEALKDFGDKDGAFVTGNFYHYVEDFNGITLAHPVHPQKVGVSLLNATDPNGLLLMRGLCDTAAEGDTATEGDGYFIFKYQDPGGQFHAFTKTRVCKEGRR